MKLDEAKEILKNNGYLLTENYYSYILVHISKNGEEVYCKNKYGEWTTHIEDAYEGSTVESIKELIPNFAEFLDVPTDDIDIRRVLI